MKVRYPLRTHPWTWDFYTWLVIEMAKGATAIDFGLKTARSKKWGFDESWKRYHNYLKPGPPLLAGLPVSEDDPSAVVSNEPCTMDFLPKTFERLELREFGPETADFTVTLRDTFRNEFKNSKIDIWTQFANEIGARIIPDARHQDISLRDRYTLYARAKMNYGVPNGPVSIIWYTRYPLTMFADPILTRKGWSGHLVKVGSRMPHLLENQRVIWEPPTLDNLLKAHRENFPNG